MDLSSDSLLPPPPPPPAAQPPLASTSLPPPPPEPSTNILPPRPIPEPQPDYGRRYDMLLQALEVAVRKGVNKFTFVPSPSPSLDLLKSSFLILSFSPRYKDFSSAFPLQTLINPKECNQVYIHTGEQLRTRIIVRSLFSFSSPPIPPSRLNPLQQQTYSHISLPISVLSLWLASGVLHRR